MTRNILLAAGALGALATAAAPLAAQSSGRSSDNFYRVDFRPLNNSGASGQAVLQLSPDERRLNVFIQARGLEPGGAHVSHIHGRSENGQPVDSTCPTKAQDSDGDGFVELDEGKTVYGPILIDFGNIDPDKDGRVQFRTTVNLSGSEMALPLDKRHIVIHGLTVPPGPGEGTPGEVDGTNGYLTVLPVLCGEIQPNGNRRR